jgi:hypothetical protein
MCSPKPPSSSPEVNINDILTRGADPGQDGVYEALAIDVAVIASTWALLSFLLFFLKQYVLGTYPRLDNLISRP